MKKKILVTGGAGYIGSALVQMLNSMDEYSITVFDNLENGYKHNVPSNVKLVVKDLRNYADILTTMQECKPDVVVHFAAYALVGESMEDPLKYYSNNITSGINLLMAMEAVGCKHIMFSSSCATYGIPARVPISETDMQQPVNPYGHSKYLFEQILKSVASIKHIDYTIFRYFNAAGAYGNTGEEHVPETHLIPNVVDAVMNSKEVCIYGNDYDTADGSCIRDYVHVADLAAAYVIALKNQIYGEFNLGTGNGISNFSIVNEVEAQLQKKAAVNIMPRRPGDPDKLVADSSKAQSQLGWQPVHSSIQSIIQDAIKFKKRTQQK